MPMAEERRLVTVLFADAVGSTALGEALDPEDMRALMSRYFAIARDVVKSHDGTVEKFIGDAVMAVFGLPRAHDDDAARALDAALELRDRVRADAVLGERLPIRLGVNTGEVVAGPAVGGLSGDVPGTPDTLITGDAVNVAARLQQGAEPWTIVCGARTVRAAGGRFTFGQLGTTDARGRTAAVAAAILHGRAARREIARRTKIVGREADLDQLDLVARRAFRERRPYLVTVIAPAGTGKSRLLEEFLDRMGRFAPEATVATAQCLPYGQRLTYWPMRTLLLRLLDLPDEVGPESIRRATRAWLDDLGDPNAAAHSDLLAATVGAGTTEVTDRTALFGAWRTAIEQAALRRPLLLVVEDLHWSSDSLLDLIEAILQPRADAPLMMIALSRPELLDRRPAWGGGRRNHVSLALASLDDPALEALVEDLLEAPAPEIVQAVVARSDGNPFFAGELVRSIIDRAGALDDRAAIEQALAALPDNVQATVLARLDLLPPLARRALQVGAVFGRTFRAPGLVVLAPELQEDLSSTIDELRDRDLVRTSGADSVTFRHILIREVAYGTLPRAERARLHGAAGAWLESTAGGNEEALAELIAYHFREAVVLGRAAGADPGDATRSRAVNWLRRASEAAMAATATIEATRHLAAAIDLAEPDELPELHERLGDALFSGHAAVDAYATALQLARDAGRPPEVELRILAAELMVITRWHGSVGRSRSPDLARDLSAAGRRLLPYASDDRVRARFLIADGFRAWVVINERGGIAADEHEEFLSYAREGLALARRIGDVGLESAALDALSSAAMGIDDYRASLEFVEQRLAIGDRLDLVERLDALTMVAWHLTTLGDLRAAAASAVDSLGLLVPGQAPSSVMSTGAWLVADLHVLGRWDEAASVSARIELAWHALDRPSAGYMIQGVLAALDIGRARRDEGLTARARATAEAILEQFEPDDRVSRLGAFVRLDLAAIERDIIAEFRRFTGRLDHLDRAIAACTDRAHFIDPTVLRDIVRYTEPRGIQLVAAQARRALSLATADAAGLRAALAEFDAMGAVPYAARVRTELGVLTEDAALVAEGRIALETIGDLDQLGRMAAWTAAPAED